MISKTDFQFRILNLPKTIPSKTGSAKYTKFHLDGRELSFVRVNKGTKWSLDIDDLYAIYKSKNFINTSVVKKVTGARVNSPSVAILMAIGCIDHLGNRFSK